MRCKLQIGLLFGWISILSLSLSCPGQAFRPVRLKEPGYRFIVDIAQNRKKIELKKRLTSARLTDEGLELANSAQVAGITVHWVQTKKLQNYAVVADASVEKEGLNGGWGIEFASPDKIHAYRVLVYTSGCFCVDRFFGLYPEFVHCLPFYPAVHTATSRNQLKLVVKKNKVEVWLNGQKAVTFKDERITPGYVGVAVAGSGSKVVFHTFSIYDLQNGKGGK